MIIHVQQLPSPKPLLPHPQSLPPKRPLSPHPPQVKRRIKMMIHVQQLPPNPELPEQPQFVADKSPIWDSSKLSLHFILCDFFLCVREILKYSLSSILNQMNYLFLYKTS